MEATLDFRKPHVLRSEDEYNAAVERIDDLLRENVPDESEDGEELLFLSVLVEEYEGRHYPLEPMRAIEAVEFMAEQRGLNRADLAEAMGGASRVSDFLNGRRDLSKNQARALSELLGIPLSVLLG